MVLLMIAVLALAPVVVYLLLSALAGWRQTSSGEPLQALAERYAWGEIDREEFLRRQQDLLDAH